MTDLIGQQIGRYEVLRQIGSGGMSTVYKASDVETNRLVAIKLMASFLTKEEKFLTRFEREVELLTQFDHPNIVKVYDFGEYMGSPYIVMPFMSMGTLQDRLRGAPMKATEVAKMMSEMSSALQYAHDKGIVHRDIKPSNILIDEKGNAMLSDFGFARWREASLSLTGSALVGTPSYMSPEQCLGEQVTPFSDQYSLGVVLYRVATGQLPFDGETPLAIALKQINEALPPPQSVNPKLPIEIANVLEKVLQKNPKERYANIAVFNEAFQRALEAVRQASDKPTTVLPRIGRVKIFFDRLGRQLR
ncbi:MAG: serine/threonine-protein kinase, partial [Anaerolineales bacterium]